MCVLDPQGIPETLVKFGINSVDVAVALGTLQAFSLISSRTDETLQIRRNERTFDIHRLVYLAMRSWLASEMMLVPTTVQATKIMNFRLSRMTWETKLTWSAYLPHAAKLLHENRVEDLLPGKAYMKRALRIATYEDRIIEPLESENFADRHHTPGHSTDKDPCPACFASLHYKVSECFGLDGNYALALSYAEESFVIRTFTLGTCHVDTISSMIQVVQLLTEEGGYLALKSAAVLGNQAVTQSLKYGEDHFLHLESMLALSSNFCKQRQYRSARDLGEKVLSSHSRRYGPSDARTWESMTNLATTNAYLQPDEALDLFQKVAEMRTKFLGPDHPQTLLSVTNLAAMYRKIGDRSTAATLQVKTLAARRRVTGDKHPETMRCMANLATTCTALGAFRKAEKLYKEVLELRQEGLAPLHPDTLTSMANLGRLYMKEQRWQEAREIFGKVVPWSKEKLGEIHPDTIKRDVKLQICINECNNSRIPNSIANGSIRSNQVDNAAQLAEAVASHQTRKILYNCLLAVLRPPCSLWGIDYRSGIKQGFRLCVFCIRRMIGIAIPIVYFLDAVYERREGWLQSDYYWPDSDGAEWAAVASISSGGLRPVNSIRSGGSDPVSNRARSFTWSLF